MWELDHKEGWVLNNWCFWTVVLEKTLENPLDCKEIKPVNCKGNQSWIFIRRTDAQAPILWPPNVKSWLITKDPEAGKGWRQEAKGMAEDRMVGWHHRLNGYGFEQAPGDAEGQRSLAYCSLWGRKESDTTEWLNNNSNNYLGLPHRCEWSASVNWMHFDSIYAFIQSFIWHTHICPVASMCQTLFWVLGTQRDLGREKSLPSWAYIPVWGNQIISK